MGNRDRALIVIGLKFLAIGYTLRFV